MFDWPSFLDSHGIKYVTSGRNLARGNIGISCPLCGDDPSQHLNISLKGKGWGCWRNAEHSGKSNARLIKALINCSETEARRIAGYSEAYVPSAEEMIEKLIGEHDELSPKMRHLSPPKDWRPLYKASGPSASVCQAYLRSRKYSQHDVNLLSKRFELQYSLNPKWSKRIIFPIRNERGELVNYTGRTIGNSKVRYRTMEGVDAAVRMSQSLFDLQTLVKTTGRVLVVQEGPFDAARVSYFGELYGVYATCIFTQNLSEVQRDILGCLMSNFEMTVVLFDQGAASHLAAMKAASELSLYGRTEVGQLPVSVKDTGAMEAQHILELCQTYLGML